MTTAVSPVTNACLFVLAYRADHIRIPIANMYRSSFQPSKQSSNTIEHDLARISHDSSASNDNTAKAAFLSLPSIIQHRLPQYKRVVMVANNPSITRDYLEKLLQTGDLIVLFNDFIHADFFSTQPLVKTLPKLLFFRHFKIATWLNVLIDDTP